MSAASVTLAGLGGGSKPHNDAADFGRNPHGAEFGEYGRCQVRFGKAKKGSPPKRRGVLTVFDWTRENSEQARTRLRGVLNWAMQGRLCPRSLAVPTMKDLPPARTERGPTPRRPWVPAD